MTNREWLNSLSAEELYEFDKEGMCHKCIYHRQDGCDNTEPIATKSYHNVCKKGYILWLNQERNPMPEIQAGDILFTGNISDFYVAIAPNMLVKANCFVVLDLANVLSHDKIEYVARWKDEINDIERIWRAENDR